jgi:choline kinase
MRAVILCAGQGRRLLPHTTEIPKGLLPVSGDRSILALQLETLAACDVREACVVVGHGAAHVEAFLARRPVPAIRTTTRMNPFHDVSDNLVSCWLARDALHGNCVLLNGDTLFEPEVLRRLLAAPPAPICVATQRKDAYDEDDMKVDLDGRGRLCAIGKTLPASRVDAESMGILRLRDTGPARFRRALDDAVRGRSSRRAYYLEVIDRLARQGGVESVDMAGLWWREIDSPSDLARATAGASHAPCRLLEDDLHALLEGPATSRARRSSGTAPASATTARRTATATAGRRILGASRSPLPHDLAHRSLGAAHVGEQFTSPICVVPYEPARMSVAAVRRGYVGLWLVGVEIQDDGLPAVHVADPELVDIGVRVQDAVIDARGRSTEPDRHVMDEVAGRLERLRADEPHHRTVVVRPFAFANRVEEGLVPVQDDSVRPCHPRGRTVVDFVGFVVDLEDKATVSVVDVGEPAVGGVGHTDRVVPDIRHDGNPAGLQVDLRYPRGVVMLRAPWRRENGVVQEAASRVDGGIRMAHVVAHVFNRDGLHDPVLVLGIEEPCGTAAGIASEGHDHAVAPLPIGEPGDVMKPVDARTFQGHLQLQCPRVDDEQDAPVALCRSDTVYLPDIEKPPVRRHAHAMGILPDVLAQIE